MDAFTEWREVAVIDRPLRVRIDKPLQSGGAGHVDVGRRPSRGLAMHPMFAVLALVVSQCHDRAVCGSYLYQPAYCLDKVLRGPAEPYDLQEGDIVFSTDYNFAWEILFAMAGTGHPHHSGIAFRKLDGQMAILEAGPHDTLFVEVLDAL